MHKTLIPASLVAAGLALGGFLATGAAHADPFTGDSQHFVDDLRDGRVVPQAFDGVVAAPQISTLRVPGGADPHDVTLKSHGRP